MTEMRGTPESSLQFLSDRVRSSRVLTDLPTEIVLEIASYLSVMDTLNLCLSSRRLQQMIREHPSTMILEYSHIIIDYERLEFIANPSHGP